MNNSIENMSVEIAIKKCITCKKELPIDNFGKRRYRSCKPDGHLIYYRYGECKECANKRKALWRSQHPDYMKIWYKNQRQNEKK